MKTYDIEPTLLASRDSEIIGEFKQQIVDYKNELYADKNKWLVEQIKYSILMGNFGLRLGIIPKSGYKKAKNLFNFWKEVDSKYYFKDLNILITDQHIKNRIDYILGLGLNWFIGIEWNTLTTFSEQLYALYIKL